MGTSVSLFIIITLEPRAEYVDMVDAHEIFAK